MNPFLAFVGSLANHSLGHSVSSRRAILQALVITPIVAGCLLLTSCGWETKLTFQERGGTATVIIYQPFPINEAGMKVVLVDGSHNITLIERHADTFLHFVNVYWTADHHSVAVFTCGSEVAYDRSSGVFTPFSEFSARVAEQIRQEYRVSTGVGDDRAVFSWACAEGSDEFLKRYPEARAR